MRNLLPILLFASCVITKPCPQASDWQKHEDRFALYAEQYAHHHLTWDEYDFAVKGEISLMKMEGLLK